MDGENLEATLTDYEPRTQVFLRDVLKGLWQTPKVLPCKYFYNKSGSELFDEICNLDEYYLTRTELAIMENYVAEMADQIGQGVMLVEYGSGSSAKTRILLDHLEDPVAYVPVDISRIHLQSTANQLSAAYRSIEVLPVCVDFTTEFVLPKPKREPTHSAVYFPGSTIGNFRPLEARQLLERITPLCGMGGGLLIGIDLKKDVGMLEAAYNDREGVTAAFNLNLLHRINRELEADFQIETFEHRAIYNEHLGRVEMYVESQTDQMVTVAGESFLLVEGERICTEHSHKYTIEQFSTMASGVGLTLRKAWTDDRNLFGILHFIVT